MPGIPSSARCLGCKRRKVKCDLRWPTCTTCERANLECSGPTLTTKFIHASSQGHSTDHNASGLVIATAESRGARRAATNAMPSLPAVSCTQAERRKMFNLFQLAPSPRQYPSTVADRIAKRLINTIERDPVGEILYNASYLELLPQRLAESPALRDCVAFFCFTWTNFQRAEVMEQSSVFIESHGKALRSLMRAMQNPDTQLSAETCAAITLMARCNLLFDSGEREIHVDGLAKMMRRKGPPKKGDGLYKQLAICNNGIVLRHWAAHGGECLYLHISWKETLGSESSPEGMTVSELDTKGLLVQLNYISGQWITLFKCMKKIRNPRLICDERKRLGERTHHLAAELVSQCDSTYQLCVLNYQSGMPMQAALGEDYPSQYTLDELPPNHDELLRPLVGYMVVRILYARIAFDSSCVLGEPDLAIYESYHQTCQQAWGLLPHLLRINSPLAILNYAFPVYLCFEILEEQTNKDYLIDALKATNVKRMLPAGRKDTERWLMNICLLMTGRDLIKEDLSTNGDGRSNLEMNIYT